MNSNIGQFRQPLVTISQSRSPLMDELLDRLALGSKAQIHIALSQIASRNKEFRQLIVYGQWSRRPWMDMQIRQFLYTLSLLDSNNHSSIHSSKVRIGYSLS